MLGCLIRIDAQNAAGGAVTLRLASLDVPELCHLGGEQWEPALAVLPDFALDFFGGAFAGQVTTPGTSFAASTSGVAAFSADPAGRARFARARCRVWVGDPFSSASGDLGPLALWFDGRISQEPAIDEASRIARFEVDVDAGWADKPVLPLFAGTGGIEGPQQLAGQPKPLCLGNVRFARGVLIDSVDNVWMVSAGPVQGISAAYDRLGSLGPSSGDHPDLAALLAASIPNGSWATCLAQGLVRLGAPPDGRVCFDVQGSNAGAGGYVRRAGAMMRRIADLAGGTINAASLAALDTARPFNQQLQLTDQTTAREIIAALADSVAAVAGVSLTGELFAQPLGIVSGGEALNADDSSAARILAVEELSKLAPDWRLATEAELTFEVHSQAEIAFQYRWQGEWSAVRVYRRDDVVTGPDGAAFAYINGVPAAGQALPVAPAVSNASWELFTPRPAVDLASQVTNKSLANLDAGANQTLFAAYQPRQNLLFNARFALGLNSWANVTGAWRFVRDASGQFVEQPLGTGGTFVLRSSVPIFAGPSSPLVISLQGFANNAGPGAGIFADIEWRNGGNDTVLGFSSNISGNGAAIFANVPAANPAYVSQAVVAPSPTDGSGFVRAFVRLVSVGTVAYASGGHVALGVKVEAGTTASAISDEATDGAVLDNTFGRIRDPEAYNTQAILGPMNVTDLVPSYTVGASNVTVTLPAHVRKIATRTGPRTLSYGSASGVVGFNQPWWAFIDDSELTGFASPTVSFTGDPADLMFPGRYQIAAGIAPDSGGAGGSANPGGGMFPTFIP